MRENEIPISQPKESRRQEKTVGAGGGIGHRPEASCTDSVNGRNITIRSWEEHVQAMQAQIHDVLATVKGPDAIEEADADGDSLFSQAIMACPLLPKFKMPTMDSFDGSKDPVDDLKTYKTLMHLTK